MRKSFWILLLVMALALSGTAMAAKTEISIWYSLGAEYSAPLEKLISDFNSSQNQIAVKGVFCGDYQATLEKLLAAVVSGKPPVLSQIEQMRAGQFIDNGSVVPLQNYINKDKEYNIKDYNSHILNACKVNGKIYSLPLNPSTLLLYYNKDLFRKAGLNPEKPPTTWDEAYQMSQKISALGNNIVGMRLYPGDWTMEAIIWQFGGEVLSPNGRKVLFNQPEAVKALAFWKKMIDDGAAIWRGGREGSEADLSGRVGMVFRSSGSVEYMKANVKYDLGVAVMPKAKQFATPIGGANIYLFDKASSAEKEAAVKFIKFLTKPDNMLTWGINTGYMVSRLSALNSSQMQGLMKEDPRRMVTYNQLAYARPRPSFGPYPEINKIMMDAFDEALLGKATPQAALDAAARKAGAVIKEYYGN